MVVESIAMSKVKKDEYAEYLSTEWHEVRLALLCDSASEKVKVALALPDPKTDLSSDGFRTLCVRTSVHVHTDWTY